MGILDTSVTGLLAAQRSLAVTSHNIANVNTPGYSRQLVEYNAREASFTGIGFLGNGVEVTNIVRAHSEFLTTQLRNSVSGQQQASTVLSLSSRIDTMLADEQTGLSQKLQNYFNALQDLADLPASATSRQILLSEGQSLVSQFQFVQTRLGDMTNELRIELNEDINQINTITTELGRLNDRIVKSLGETDGQPPNDLLDLRDRMVQDLAAIVSVTTSTQFDGSMNIFIGNGQPLVLGAEASTISLSENYSGNYNITLASVFNTVDITENVNGGSLGGILSFNKQILTLASNGIGRLAIGLAEIVNQQHRLGVNLDGNINVDFFNVAVPEVLEVGLAPSNVTSAITDPNQLSDSDYELVFTGGNNYILTRLSDNQTTAIDTGGVSPFTTATIDGFNLTITAGAAVNDSYIIRPTVNGARDLSLNITQPNQIAAAGIINGQELTDSSGLPLNNGNAQIGDIQITTTTGLPLPGPVTLTFDSVLNQFNVSAPPGGTLAYDPLTEANGKQFTLPSLGNVSFTIAGVPDDGDQFELYNVTAEGDNRNALALAELRDNRLMLNGTTSVAEAYNQIVADVGTITRQTEISNESLTALLQQAETARDSISGVNLEEEAANMLKFQQAFQAAAQMIRTADTIFQDLINAFR